jgi:hypothetical protein
MVAIWEASRGGRTAARVEPNEGVERVRTRISELRVGGIAHNYAQIVIVSPALDGKQVRIRSRLPDDAGGGQEWVGPVEEALDLMADLGRGVSQESFWRTLRSA